MNYNELTVKISELLQRTSKDGWFPFCTGVIRLGMILPQEYGKFNYVFHIFRKKYTKKCVPKNGQKGRIYGPEL